jgi:hypothetical protein
MARSTAPDMHAQTRLTPITLVGGLVLALGVLRLLGEASQIWELPSRDDVESIVYAEVVALLHGEPLYRPLATPPWTVTLYMPLFYLLTAPLQWLLGPGFLAGRLVTLAASIGVAVAAGTLARRVLGDAGGTMLAVGLVLTLGFAGPPGPPWLALYRVDVLGVAFGVGAMAVLAGGTERRRVILAAVLATLALLTKQTLLAAAVAGAAWLFEQDRRRAALYGGIVGGSVLAVCTAAELLTGAFFQSVVTANANPFDLGSLLLNLEILAILQTAQVVAALLLVARHGRGRPASARRLVVYYWLATMIPLLGLGKVASWHNYWIEWSVPTAILAVAGIQAAASPARLSVVSRAAFAVAAAALVGSVAMATIVTAWSVNAAVEAAADRDERATALADVLDCVRATPGEAVAMPIDAVVLAGKPLFIDAAIHKFLVDAGQIATAPLVQTIRSGGVGVAVMDLRPEADQWRHGAGQPIWHEDVLAALRESMVLRSEKGGRLIYTPKGSQPPAACL